MPREATLVPAGFLLGALTIVEIMDAHKGFDIITKAINATKSRDLLVIIGIGTKKTIGQG